MSTGVKIVKDKQTGYCIGKAFIDYDSVETAENVTQNMGNEIEMSGLRVQITIKEEFPTDKKDWDCPSCYGKNKGYYKKCQYCYTKMKTVDDSESNFLTISKVKPTIELMVRGIDIYTTEKEIIQCLSDSAVIQQVKIVRDYQTKKSKGYCFVEYASIEDATETLRNLHDPFYINGSKVDITFAKRSHLEVEEDLTVPEITSKENVQNWSSAYQYVDEEKQEEQYEERKEYKKKRIQK